MDDILAATVEPVLVVVALACGLLIRRPAPLLVVAVVVGLLHGVLLDLVGTTGEIYVEGMVLGVVAALMWAYAARGVRGLLAGRRSA